MRAIVVVKSPNRQALFLLLEAAGLVSWPPAESSPVLQASTGPQSLLPLVDAAGRVG